jgi:hypothetical protein
MLNARHSFALLWQRLVAALSLVMAAALAPAAVSAPAGGAGAGAIGSRAGSGTAVASATALSGNVAAVVEGGQLERPLDPSTDGTAAKALPAAVWHEIAPLGPEAVCPPRIVGAAPPTHAARSGPARAPPLA